MSKKHSHSKRGNRPEAKTLLAGEKPRTIVEIKSFGFKYEQGPESDLQFDLRNRIRNPQRHLPKGSVGTSNAVKRAVLDNDKNMKIFQQYLARIRKLLANKSEVAVSFGCRSGIHRSVVFAEELAKRLRKEGCDVRLTHIHLRDR